jgi:hypothetical protein
MKKITTIAFCISLCINILILSSDPTMSLLEFNSQHPRNPLLMETRHTHKYKDHWTIGQILHQAILFRDNDQIEPLIVRGNAQVTDQTQNKKHTGLHLATNSTKTLGLLFEYDPKGSFIALTMKNENQRTPLQKLQAAPKSNLSAEFFLKEKLQERSSSIAIAEAAIEAIATEIATATPITTSKAKATGKKKATDEKASYTGMPPLTLLACTASAVENYGGEVAKMYGRQYRTKATATARKRKHQKNVQLPRTKASAAKLLCTVGRR